MIAFPESLEGVLKAFCLERREAETQYWRRACRRAAVRKGRAGQSHRKHSLNAALRQSWQDPFFVLFGLFLESSPNSEIFHL